MILFSYSYVPGLGSFVTIWLIQPKSKDRGEKTWSKKGETHPVQLQNRADFLTGYYFHWSEITNESPFRTQLVAFEAVKNIITLLTLGIKQPWFSHNRKIWVKKKKQNLE